jgi:alkaline phosphatase
VESAKKLYVDKFPVRYATRDDDSFQVDDPPADLKWSWYALNWSEYLEWDGSSPISAEERERLQTLVRAIHRKGRHVRFYGAPDTKLAWEESKKADVDLIETDSLDAFNHYWSGI